MKWSVPQLLKQKNFQFERTVDVSDLKERDKQIRSIDPVQVSGNVTASGNTFTFDLRIRGNMILPCSRTLEDVHFPFDIKAREIFRVVESDEASYRQEDEMTDEFHLVARDFIDLMPYIKEHILLEIPMQVFNEEASAHMVRSGLDWELVDEETLENDKKSLDPRFAKLAQFFAKNDDEKD